MRKIQSVGAFPGVGSPRRERLKVAVLADVRIAVARDFLRGFYGYVRPERDWLVLQAPAAERELEAVLRWKPDFLVAPSVARLTAALEGAGMPVLFYLGALAAAGRFWFHPDERGVGEAAARHLLASGYRHAACVYDSRHHGSRLRKEGFVRVNEAAGVETFTLVEPAGAALGRDARAFTSEDPLMQEWLGSLPPSTGIYTWTDSAALWVAECCFRMDIEVPERIGLVGTDNDPDVCLRAWPGLDSVILPYLGIGEAVGRWIDSASRGEDPPPPDEFPVAGVYRRKSTLLQASPGAEWKPFYDALRQTPLEELSVPALVRASGWSRRTLERRVREQAGSSVNSLIERRRLEEAEYLLANTDRTVADVAGACGFATTRSLELLFRKYYGITPGGYAKTRRLG
jgi:DNA-binding LacI/PurR family transcriptional regulator